MFQNEQRITITARDLKVVSALQCDGRMTMQALADKVGISVYAATESYRRLTESNIMSIVPVCNPLSLGNYSQVLVGLRLDGSRDEALAKQLQKKKPQKKKSEKTAYDIEIEKIQNTLSSAMGTKVRINHTAKKGKIEIEYYGNEDLERVLGFFNIKGE